MKNSTFAGILVILLSAYSASSQMFRQVPFGLTESNLTEQIRDLKAKDPKISPEDLAANANEFFKANGIAFTVILDEQTCAKVRELAKDPKANLTISGGFQSIGGEKVKLVLPPVSIAKTDCGGCTVQLPVFEMTANSFITSIRGIKIQIVFPSNFSTNVIGLAGEDTSKFNKVWRVPYRSTPLGISYDQTVIYLGFNDPELSGLSLAVFDSGGFEICTRREAEENGPGKIDLEKKTTAEKHILFDRLEVKSRLVFKPAC